jgi:hypothetical protein
MERDASGADEKLPLRDVRDVAGGEASSWLHDRHADGVGGASLAFWA